MFKLLFLAIHLLSIAAVPMFGEENGSGQLLANNCWSHLSSLSDKILCDQWLQQSKARTKASIARDSAIKNSNSLVIQKSLELETPFQPLTKDTKENELPPNSELKDTTETVKLESFVKDDKKEMENSKLSENHEKESIQPLEKPFIEIKNSKIECNQRMQHKDMNRNEKPELSNPYSILDHEIEEKEDLEEKSEPLNEDTPKLKRKTPKIQSEDKVFKEAALKKKLMQEGSERNRHLQQILNDDIREKKTDSDNESVDIPNLSRKKTKNKVQPEDKILKDIAIKQKETENESKKFWIMQNVYTSRNLTILSQKLRDRSPSILTELKNLNRHHILEPLFLQEDLLLFSVILAKENINYVLEVKEALSGSKIAKETFHFILWISMQSPDLAKRRSFYTEIGLLLCKIREEMVSNAEIIDSDTLPKIGSKKGASYLNALKLIQDVKDGKIDTFNDPTNKDKWDLKFLSVLDEYGKYGTLLDFLRTMACRNRFSYFQMIDYLIEKSKSPKRALDIKLSLTRQTFLGFMNDHADLSTRAGGEEFEKVFFTSHEMDIQSFFISVWIYRKYSIVMQVFTVYLKVKSLKVEDFIPFDVYLYHIVLSPASVEEAIEIIDILPYSMKWERIDQLAELTRYLNQLNMPWENKIKLEAIRWLYFGILLKNQNLSPEIITKCEEIRELVNGKGQDCKIEANIRSWLVQYNHDRQKSILEELIRKNMQLNQLLSALVPSVKQRYKIK